MAESLRSRRSQVRILPLQYDTSSEMIWPRRMAKAAEYMGKGVQGTLKRVRQGEGQFSDLEDVYRYFYFMQGSAQVPGNAAKALELIELAQRIDPEGKNYRTQRMIAGRTKLEMRAGQGTNKE